MSIISQYSLEKRERERRHITEKPTFANVLTFKKTVFWRQRVKLEAALTILRFKETWWGRSKGPVVKNLLAVKGTQVQSWIQEDSTCHGTMGPMGHNLIESML